MNYLKISLWFNSELKLMSLCKLLQTPLKLSDFYFDMENLYEWGEADSQNKSWQINISRKHYQGNPWPSQPYHILFTGSPPDLNNLAQLMADILKVEVNLGTIEYQGGDDYAYKSMKIFNSK